MKIDRKKLEELIRENPQVDAELLEKALSEAEGIATENDSMVNFKLRLPYASDNYEKSIQNSWDVI
ncbi:MAG: hypothetical protein ACFE0S_09560 [Rhodospirillales bacterium]